MGHLHFMKSNLRTLDESFVLAKKKKKKKRTVHIIILVHWYLEGKVLLSFAPP